MFSALGIQLSLLLITSGYAGWKPSVEDEPVKSKMLLNTQTEEIIKNFKIHYPHLTVYFEKAYGYAVFPTITKGGIGIGAAHGTGEVYEKGEYIGTASMTQVTIGASLADKHTVKLYFSKTKKLLRISRKETSNPVGKLPLSLQLLVFLQMLIMITV